MLSLSGSQKTRLATLQKSSFYHFCKMHGYAPAEHEEFLLQLVKNDLQRIATAQGYDSYNQYPDDMKSVIDSTDYWTVTSNEHKRRASQIAEDIVKVQDLLPINWDYVRNLADELEIGYANKDELIRNVITALPHIPMFEVDFNAFVGKELLLDNIPCVCVHESLPTASRSLIDVLSNGMFHFNPDRNGVELRNPAELMEIGRKQWFMEACKTCMDMVLGRSTGGYLEREACASLSIPELFLPIRTMTATAHYFTWFHEYGHLLMGHLQRDPCHEIEYEADAFALRIVEATASNDLRGPYVRFGAFSLLTILHLIETVENVKESISHPPAKKRISRLLRMVKEEDVDAVRSVVSSMITLVQAVAEHYYLAPSELDALNANIIKLDKLFAENLDKIVGDINVINATFPLCVEIVSHPLLSCLPTQVQIYELRHCIGTFLLRFISFGEIDDLHFLLGCLEFLDLAENGHLRSGFRQATLSDLEAQILDSYRKTQKSYYLDRANQVRNEIKRVASQEEIEQKKDKVIRFGNRFIKIGFIIFVLGIIMIIFVIAINIGVR
ncbi:MAG: hypothetical protein JW934_22560 [Anaerolineae bacterium]|nr:hypothetical protein [Anaerolineae bacterium]